MAWALPAQQPELARPVFVHDDPQRQGDGRQQEGAYRERQVQHLVLFFTNQPAVHLQGPFCWDQRPHLHPVSEAEYGALAVVVLLELVGRRCWRQHGHVVAGDVTWKIGNGWIRGFEAKKNRKKRSNNSIYTSIMDVIS